MPPAISGRARVAGVIGWPVGHSLSPRLHGYWLDSYRIDGAYVPLPVRPEDLQTALVALPKLGFVGANITVPHKEAALPCLDEVSEAVRRIGAVNTIVIDETGRLIGSNTDASGFRESLQAGAPEWRPEQGPIVVLGAGGAARAILFALIESGAREIRLVNRNRQRAETVAHALGGPIVVSPWKMRADVLEDARLLINATTLGMTGQEPLALSLDRLPTSAVVVDAVYRPLRTELLATAAARGNRVIDGLGMLMYQAKPGFRAWFGRDPEVTPQARSFVLEGLGEG